MAKLVGRKPVELNINSLKNGYVPIYDSGSKSWNTISTGSISASFATTALNILGGATNYIPFFSSSTLLSSSFISQIGTTITINDPNYTQANPEALLVYQANRQSINIISGKANLDNYAQLNIFNTNNGVNASSDIVATANNGNEFGNYIDMGINGASFNSGFIGGPNDAYLYSTGSHLHIGNASPNMPIQFFVGGTDTDLYRKLELNYNNQHNITGSLEISGSLKVNQGITGSLFGSASYANNTTSASYLIGFNPTTTNTGSFTGSFTGSLLGTSSIAINAQTASFLLGSVSNATSASYASTASNSINALSASYLIGFNPTTTNTGSFTGSFTGSLFGTSSVAISSSYALTASSADNFTVRGTLTAQTLVVQVITASTEYSSGSNIFGNSLSNTQIFTGSVGITGSLAVNGSNVVLSNQTSSMSVLSASYATTASYITNAVSSSYSLSSSYTATASYAATSQTASYILNAVSASYAATASYITTAQTASYILNAVSSSYSLSSSYATTASYIRNAISSSYATTASYAISASNTILLNNTSSTVFATTGSNNFIGNQIISGSLVVSGSSTFSNSQFTVTGSVNISGSTTQIGNNNLLGNTTLSGSIIISGSQGSATPSVQIYGDIKQHGYIQFEPVNTNINTTISSSYIYVSGSTNDLYFSQNGSGYSNVTRLRWLEGNLYTGLLNGGIITTASSTVYNISSGSGIIVNLNASTIANPYPTIQYLNWGNLSANIAPYTASYDQQFVGIQSNGTIFAQGTPFTNSQNDTLIPIGVVLHQNRSTINGVKTQPSLAYGYKQRSSTFIKAFGPLKLSGFALAQSGSSTGSLTVSSGTSFSDGANYPSDPNNPSYVVDPGTTVSKIFRYRQSGSQQWVYDTNGGAGYGSIDPTQYSNNGVLTTLTGTNANNYYYSIQRVFWFPNSATKAIVVYYGNAQYPDLTTANQNIQVESFTEAPNTAANAIYLGALILRKDANFTDTTTYQIIPGGLFRSVGGQSGGGGTIVSTALSTLSDVTLSNPTNNQLLVYDSSTQKWYNSSTVTANVTGSLIGNASTATTASYALTASIATSSSYATTASFLLGTIGFATNATSASYAATASYVLTSISSSYTLTSSLATSSSYATTASYVNTARTASYINPLTQSLFVSGAIDLIGGLTIRYPGNPNTANLLQTDVNGYISVQNVAYNNTIGSGNGYVNLYVDYPIISTLSAYMFSNNTNATPASQDASISRLGSSKIGIGNGTVGSSNGSIVASSFTGSLSGTASFATNATSASYATTASFLLGTIAFATNATSASYAATASIATSSSYATTASFLLGTISNATSASYAATASYVNPLNQNVTISGSLLLNGTNGPIYNIQTINSSLILEGAAGGGVPFASQLRITANNGAWTDGVTSSYFQIKTTGSFGSNNYVTFQGGTYGSDAPFDRLQFASKYTSFTNGLYGTTPVPLHLVEITNTGSNVPILGIRGAAGQTANYVNINVSGSATGSLLSITKDGVVMINTTASSTESNLFLGGLSANEGGQLTLQPGLSYTSGAMLDNYQNQFRILKGTATTSDSSIAIWNLATKQFSLPAYTGSGAFPGTAAGYLAIDTSGNIITTTGAGGSTTPGGSNTQIQYNNSNAFGGVPTLTYDGTTLRATGSFSGSLTGSLFGTASVATTASYAATASYVLNAVSSSYSLSSSYAVTASYVLNAVSSSVATSASYAATASYASTLSIGGTLEVNNSISAASSPQVNILTRATGSFTSLFCKYTVSSGSNARSGEVISVWNGSNVQYTDFSTLDIGSTSAITPSVSLTGGNISLDFTNPGTTWLYKTLVTFM